MNASQRDFMQEDAKEIAELQAIFRYDTETGLIYRRATSNKAEYAVGSMNSDGYLVCTFKYKKYILHRLAWALAYSSWPRNVIDHINRIRNDNRLVNLRDVSAFENGLNRNSVPYNVDYHRNLHYVRRDS